MKLTRFQAQRLRFALANRGQPVPLLRVFVQGWKIYAMLTAVFGGCAVFFWLDGHATVAAGFGGFLAAVFWRDLVFARANQSIKALSDAITDWPEVQRLLDEADAA